MARLKETYKNDIAPALMSRFGYKSVMQIPKLDKVVINVGSSEAKDNAKVIDNIIGDLSLITGQKAVPTYARKSVANFNHALLIPVFGPLTIRHCELSATSALPPFHGAYR